MSINEITFSDTLPAAPAGRSNVQWQGNPTTGDISASIAGSGSGSDPGCLFSMPAGPAVSQSTGWNNYSMFLKLAGRSLNFFPTSWRVSFVAAPGANTNLTAIVVLTTAKDSNSVLSSTAITVSSSASPSLTPGFTKSDPISLTLDGDHDYWLVLHIDTASPNTEAYGWTAGTGPQFTTSNAGYVSGDQTGVTTIPSSFGGQFITFEQILAS